MLAQGSALKTGRRTFALTGRRHGKIPPHPVPEPTVAIIGAGFSGTLLALHLLRRCPRTQVLLIERHRQFGKGLAYSTGNPSHLLNVPAGRMSAFHDRPQDFIEWLEAQQATDQDGAPYAAGSFVPRSLFGTYVRHLLNAEFKKGDAARLRLLHGEVIGIDKADQLTLTLDRDRTVAAHLAVIAVGNFPPEPPPVADPWLYESPWYRGDPWGDDTLTELDPDAGVLLIGTGLTMVDTVVSLLDRGHRGQLYALSRRGLLPRPHVPYHAVPDLAPRALPSQVKALVRMLRSEITREAQEGVSWQAIFDALRPMTYGLWLSLAPEERARFLRHLRPWWDVHRHRLPPAIAARLDAARASGQLTVTAGRIATYRPADGGVEVQYRAARSSTSAQIRVDRIINCSGPACDFDRVQNPLTQDLLRRGLARPDPLRLGLDVTPQGALKGRDGAISQRLYAIGPLTKGLFWEITSVPDIRFQCEMLAMHLAQVIATRRFAPLKPPA